jgi:hypothetical protein
MDKEAACTKLQDLVWILKVLTAHNMRKIVCNLKRQNSLNSYFDADEAKINCIPL